MGKQVSSSVAFLDRFLRWPRRILYLGETAGPSRLRLQIFAWASLEDEVCWFWAQSPALPEHVDEDLLLSLRRHLRKLKAPVSALQEIGDSESGMQGSDYRHFETSDPRLMTWVAKQNPSAINLSQIRKNDVVLRLKNKAALRKSATKKSALKAEKFRRSVVEKVNFRRRGLVKICVGEFMGMDVLLYGLYQPEIRDGTTAYPAVVQLFYNSNHYEIQAFLGQAGSTVRTKFAAYCEEKIVQQTGLRGRIQISKRKNMFDQFDLIPSKNILDWIRRKAERSSYVPFA